MSVDMFGRSLVMKKEGFLKGPPGIGFSLTDSGDFNIDNKRLCNVGKSVNGEDAVNLNVLLEHRKSIEIVIESYKEFVKNKLDEEFKKVHARIEYIDAKLMTSDEHLLKVMNRYYDHAVEEIQKTRAMSFI
jgi:hypothetical protein